MYIWISFLAPTAEYMYILKFILGENTEYSRTSNPCVYGYFLFRRPRLIFNTECSQKFSGFVCISCCLGACGRVYVSFYVYVREDREYLQKWAFACTFCFFRNKLSFKGPGGAVRGVDSRRQARICARELASVFSLGNRLPNTVIKIQKSTATAAEVWLFTFVF